MTKALTKEKMGKKLGKPGRPPASQKQHNFQFKVCIWIALGYSTPQIVKLAKERLQIDTSDQNVDETYRYGKKWKKVIGYLRERYLKNASHLPIAHKVQRIAQHWEIFQEALSSKQLGIAYQVLNAIRIEVEGEKGTNINIDNRKLQQIHIEGKNPKEIIDKIGGLLKAR